MKRHIAITFAITILLASCAGRKDYDATGIFEATTVTVSAETAGKIISMPLQEGDSVFASQIVAEVDSVTLSLQKQQLLSQRKATKSSTPDISSQAAALRSQIEQARREVERQSRLLADGATTQKNYDDAEARLRTLNAQLQGLLSSLSAQTTTIGDNAETLLYQVEQIEEMIAKSTLRAPIAGTVLTKFAEPGEYATPGRPLYKLANLNDIYLRGYFTVAQLADIKLGHEVTVIADFGSDNLYEYPGVISWISQESEFTPKSIQTDDSRGNLVYAVKIRVKNDGRLKLGQYGKVRL